MVRSKITKRFFPALVILTGILLSQIFFTCFVYHSNQNRYHDIQAIISAGYLPVPNANILPFLQKMETAFMGALFFTMTAGIAFPFMVYLAAWIWDRGYRRNRLFLIVLSGLVILLMMMLNRNGMNLIISLWFLTVYLVVFKLTLFGLEGTQSRLSPKHLITHLIVLGILGLGWAPVQTDTSFFLTVRDHLLLSNATGQRITKFYYKYSPYPARAVQALQKKQLKTCRIEGNASSDIMDRMEKVFLRYDYLPVNTEALPNLTIRVANDYLAFSVDDRFVLKTETAIFLQSPSAVLELISERSDRNVITKTLLGFSFFYGLPIFLYALFFSLLHWFFSLLPGRVSGFFPAASGCLVAGLVAMFLFSSMYPESIPNSELKAALESSVPGKRLAALKTISRQKLDPSEYYDTSFAGLPSSISERIWWTISLGGTTSVKTNAVLLRLLDDPHPLVACKAYNALADNKYRSAIPTIIEKLETSRHWYTQVEAYQSLRRLGWRQKKSS